MSKALLEQQGRRAMDGSQSQGVYLELKQVNKKKHLKGADLSPRVDTRVSSWGSLLQHKHYKFWQFSQ